MTQICRTCREIKPASQFAPSLKHSSGINTECRECCNARRRARYVGKRIVDEIPDGHGRCSRCLEIKPVDEFNRRSDRKIGRKSHCRDCTNRQSRAYYYADLEGQRARGRSTKLYAYNITYADYESMLGEQGGTCANAACANRPEPGERRFHIDHDHACCSGASSCGECIRQVLCPGCNAALGLLRDDPATIRGLADYLERHNLATLIRLRGGDWLDDEAAKIIGRRDLKLNQWMVDDLRQRRSFGE